MKNLLILIIPLLLLSSCSTPPENAIEIKSHIAYTKDDRTGFCYAMISNITHGGRTVLSLSHVPCTPKVLSLITDEFKPY